MLYFKNSKRLTKYSYYIVCLENILIIIYVINLKPTRYKLVRGESTQIFKSVQYPHANETFLS